jgi:predicted ArsR family transcriptional regulator
VGRITRPSTSTYGRAVVTEISEAALALIRRLGYESRLPLLLLLEERPRSTAEVAEALGISFGTAQGQIRQLRRSGLAVVLHPEPTPGSARTTRYVYASVYTGWAAVIEALESVAKSAR